MKDVINAFLKDKGLSHTNFKPSSRYYNIETTQWKRADGQVIPHLKQRFIPKPEEFSVIQEHVVAENDRLDNIAANYFYDPELYWKICDANAAMRPSELTEETDRVLTIGSEPGLAGVPEAMEE